MQVLPHDETCSGLGETRFRTQYSARQTRWAISSNQERALTDEDQACYLYERRGVEVLPVETYCPEETEGPTDSIEALIAEYSPEMDIDLTLEGCSSLSKMTFSRADWQATFTFGDQTVVRNGDLMFGRSGKDRVVNLQTFIAVISAPLIDAFLLEANESSDFTATSFFVVGLGCIPLPSFDRGFEGLKASTHFVFSPAQGLSETCHNENCTLETAAPEITIGERLFDLCIE